MAKRKRRAMVAGCLVLVGILSLSVYSLAASWLNGLLHPDRHYVREADGSAEVRFLENGRDVLVVADTDGDGDVDYVWDRRMPKEPPIEYEGRLASNAVVYGKVVERSRHQATFQLDQEYPSYMAVPSRYVLSFFSDWLVGSRLGEFNYW